MKYSDFRKYIKNVSPDQMEEYVIEKTEDNELYGRREKKFVRFEGSLFGELIDELKTNPQCSYSTYLNDIIREGYNPEYVSVILKEENVDVIRNDIFKIGHLRETIASRIMNFFECPTTYDTLVDIDGKVKCCSVDFNKPNEVFYIADELKPYCIQIGGVGDLLRGLDSKFKVFAYEENIKQENSELFVDFMRDYVYRYLVRKLVLCDRDFGFHNLGAVHNTKENTLTLAPNFDYEYTFLNMDIAHNKLGRKIRLDDLKFIKRYYPSVYRKFLTKYHEFVDENKYEVIINKAIGKGKKSQRFTKEYKSYLTSLNSIVMENDRKM